MYESTDSREPLRIRPRDVPRDHPTRIDHDEIFRKLIADELRGGRLDSSRRRRIVRYAAQMGLSAVEAGRLMAACREEALASSDADIREHALRLALPDRRGNLPWPARVGVVVGVAVLIHLVLRALG